MRSGRKKFSLWEIFLKVKIGNEELDNFVKLNGFDICYEEDILLKEVNN